MKCKNCGGELHFQDGRGICQNCGAVFAPDSVYEKVEVYICYEESDSSGRRTKDSIIAQEVYKKLEAAKITTFYERISADGVLGEDLTAARYVAMCKAKAVLVLGASAQSFQSVAEKYGTWLEGKTIIPFCVDVEPETIPKTLSKIQAVNYATIGWEKDLIKGLSNLLGREEEIDTQSLYGRKRRKMAFFIGTVMAVLMISVVLMLIFGGVGNQPNGAMTATTTPATTAQLTQQEIYDQANAQLDEGKLLEALSLFQQIPEHPDSANRIKLVYAKFEGYYQAENINLHLNITKNTQAEVSVTIGSGVDTMAFSGTMTITANTVSGTYRDNSDRTGAVELELENEGIHFVCKDDEAQQSIETFFALSERSDQPILQIDAQVLFDWLKEGMTFSQLRTLGYELESVKIFNLYSDNRLYRIKDTEIYLSMFSDYVHGGKYITVEDKVLLGVAAPAGLIAPSKIGQACELFCEGDFAWCPQSYLGGFDSYPQFETDYFNSTESTVTENTIIGVCLLDVCQ